jgi:hypothetical protein
VTSDEVEAIRRLPIPGGVKLTRGEASWLRGELAPVPRREALARRFAKSVRDKVAAAIRGENP